LKVLLPAAFDTYRCNERGCCCRSWPIAWTKGDVVRTTKALGDTALGRRFAQAYEVVDKESPELSDFVTGAPRPRFEKTYGRVRLDARGGCAMLEDDDRCAVHAAVGEQALPELCVNFPVVALETPGGTELYFEPLCPEVRRPLYENPEPFALIEREGGWRRGVHAFRYAKPISAVSLDANRTIPWDDYVRYREEAIGIIADRAVSLFGRLARLAHWTAELDITGAVPAQPPILSAERYVGYRGWFEQATAEAPNELLALRFTQADHLLVDFAVRADRVEALQAGVTDWREPYLRWVVPAEDEVAASVEAYLGARLFSIPFIADEHLIRAHWLLHLAFGAALRYMASLCAILETPCTREVAATALALGEFTYRQWQGDVLIFMPQPPSHIRGPRLAEVDLTFGAIA